jgi:8-oxo-dGTP pyrophosphatase MutT (NUDIX family)
VFDIQSARINTAGAYVRVNGLYLFMIGIKPHDNRTPIVRLGGHREENETGWQCAVREVFEEANLQIEPLLPQATYLCDWDNFEAELSTVQWQHETEQEPAPILVVTYRRDGSTTLSLMYLARAEGIPTPSSEVKGLVLLDESEVHRLCQEPMTLNEFLNNGGRAMLKDKFDTSRILEPFAQLRLLSRILSSQPEMKAA